MDRRSFLQGALASGVAALTPIPIFRSGADYDVVLLRGRVIDPESGLNAQKNVGIRGRQITAVTDQEIRGKIEVDASGLVVAPGFIDVNAHGHDLVNNRLQAMDGVTTTLLLESGSSDVDAYYNDRKGERMLHYGCAAGHGHARRAVMGEDKEYVQPTDAQIAEMKVLIDKALGRGALACGFGLEYRPGASRWEVLEMFRVAASHGVACHVHTRFGTLLEPGSAVEGLQEILACSVVTGAPVHMIHVPSMGLKHTPRLIGMIEDAQKRGLDISCDVYPYTAFATGISSAVFDPGWQENFGITYSHLQWAATGETLSKESFEKYQKVGGLVIAHAIPEEAVQSAVSYPLSMIASDGEIENGTGHPRSAGTFSRILGKYVREQNLISLPDAIRKMTLLPARRMERRAPGMKRKGRIKVGCDADVVVFDPKTIQDRATYASPALHSVGVQHLFVNGVWTVKEGVVVESARGGSAIRGAVK